MSAPSTTGRLVAYWRLKKGLSPAALAEKVGVTRPAVLQWEKGDTAPTEANLRAIAASLDLTLAEFYGAEDDLAGHAPDDEPPAPRDTMAASA